MEADAMPSEKQEELGLVHDVVTESQTLSGSEEESLEMKLMDRFRTEMESVQQELHSTREELTMRIKHYEGKLMTMSVINSALQTEMEKLKEEAQQMGGRQESEAEVELKELHAEFTKRLGVAEKTASVMKEECFGLRNQVKELKKSNEQVTTQLANKDRLASQYLGDKESLVKKVAELESTVRRMKSDAVRAEQEKEKLTTNVQVLEATVRREELMRMAAIEEASQNMAAMRQTIAEQKENFAKLLEEAEQAREVEVQREREELSRISSQSARETGDREEILSASLEGLRQRLADASLEASEREDKLQDEIRKLELRCRAAEHAQEEADNRINEATQPLVRQMEGMSAQIARTEAAMRAREEELESKVRQAEEAVAELRQLSQQSEATAAAATRRAEAAEKSAAVAQATVSAVRHTLAAQEERHETLVSKSKEAAKQLAAAEEGRSEALAALAEARATQKDAEAARVEACSVLEEERQRSSSLLAALERKEKEISERAASSTSSSPRASPAASLLLQDRGIGAVNGWLADDFCDASRRFPGQSVGSPSRPLHARLGDADVAKRGAATGNNPVAMERLHAKIRQQQGELGLLQRELAAARATNEHTAEELLKAAKQLQEIRQDNKEAPKLRKELEELSKRHDMALIIIGERNERAEELEADLEDVRKMYREQVNLLINQVDPGKWPEGYRICLFCSHCAQIQRSGKRT